MLAPGFGIAAGQYERHATAAGRVVLESLIGPGLLVIGYMLGATGYGVWDFFSPILWTMLFALPLVIVAFTRPVTAMKGYALEAAGSRWLDIRFIRHQLLFATVLLVAALPSISLIWGDLSQLIGVQYPLTTTLKLDGISPLTVVFGWILLGWVASRTAHALMVKGSPLATAKGAVWRGLDRIGERLVAFVRFLGLKSREAQRKRGAKKAAAALGADDMVPGSAGRRSSGVPSDVPLRRTPVEAGRTAASGGAVPPWQQERPTAELPVVANITTATAQASAPSHRERPDEVKVSEELPPGGPPPEIMAQIRAAAARQREAAARQSELQPVSE